MCVCVCVCAISKVVQKSEGEKRGLFLSLSLAFPHTNHNERVLSFDAFFSHLNITRRRREIYSIRQSRRIVTYR